MIKVPAHIFPEGVRLDFIYSGGMVQSCHLIAGDSHDAGFVSHYTGTITKVIANDCRTGIKIGEWTVGPGQFEDIQSASMGAGMTITDFSLSVTPGMAALFNNVPSSKPGGPIRDGSLEMDIACLIKEKQGFLWRDLGMAVIELFKQEGWRPLEIDDDTLSNLEKSIEYTVPDLDTYITPSQAEHYLQSNSLTTVSDQLFEPPVEVDVDSITLSGIPIKTFALSAEDMAANARGVTLQELKEREAKTAATEGTCGMYKMTGECFCGANCGST